MRMIELTEYRGDDPGRPCHVNPEEVAAVRDWNYHSFRPSIAEIVLKSGAVLRVWQTSAQVLKMLRG